MSYNFFFDQKRMPWTPAVLRNRGMALWLDAADAATITLNGSNVSAWADKSGNGSHAVQANASYQPEYVTNDLNGLNGINFASSKGLYNSSASYTAAFAILVIKSPTSTWGGYHAFFDRGSSGSRIGGIAQNNNTGFYNVPLPTAAWSNGVSVTPSTSCFGSGITNANIIAFTPAVSSNTSFSIGNYDAGAVGGAAKQYELLVLSSSPSLSDRQKLEGYLAWKWGLQANLPTDHPYRYHR